MKLYRITHEIEDKTDDFIVADNLQTVIDFINSARWSVKSIEFVHQVYVCPEKK